MSRTSVRQCRSGGRTLPDRAAAEHEHQQRPEEGLDTRGALGQIQYSSAIKNYFRFKMFLGGMDRRDYLLRLAITVPTVSGCMESTSEEHEAELGELEVWNHRTREETVSIQVLDGDRIVYETTVTVGPYNAENDTVGFVELDEDWPARPGNYSLTARLSSSGASTRQALVTEPGIDCVSVKVILDEDEFAIFQREACSN